LVKNNEPIIPGDEIAVDFSGVKPFEPLDDKQTYLCEVVKFTPGTSKENNPKMSLELAIKEPKASKGRRLFREYSLMTQALPFLYQFIQAVDPTKVLDENFILRPAEYIGLECAVTVENEEFEEQIRSRVKKIFPASRY